ncbi:MAG TPA: helix-turn-helix domain-containing protein [Sporichthyaceae bacterium]|jgi:excisionase family DNA binding protein
MDGKSTTAANTAADLMTMRAVAGMFGTTERTVRRWVAGGLLPAYRVGPTLVRIRRSDAEALLRRVPTVATAVTS